MCRFIGVRSKRFNSYMHKHQTQDVYRSIPQASRMKNFPTKVNNLGSLIIIARLSISHVYMVPGYASELFKSDFISSLSLLLFAWLCYLFDIWTTSMCYNCQLNFTFLLTLFPQLSFLAFLYYFDLLMWNPPWLFLIIDMKTTLIILICWYKVHPY